MSITSRRLPERTALLRSQALRWNWLSRAPAMSRLLGVRRAPLILVTLPRCHRPLLPPLIFVLLWRVRARCADE